MTEYQFIAAALAEDIGSGDHSTLSIVSPEATGSAILKVKEEGVLAGMRIAAAIFHHLQPDAVISPQLQDGDRIVPGQTAFTLSASVYTILQGERLVLNIMQRMSGIATLTARYVDKLKGYKTRILDTRKTSPLFRAYEKEAVRIGGGTNHRMGLYDMVMLKDNHIDYCGGIEKAIARTRDYLQQKALNIPIEIETRSLDDVRRVLQTGGVDRIMLDNFPPDLVAEAVRMIDGRFETEASGGINLETIESYAATGVDFVSAGAIIHHAVSLDLSLKAQVSAS